MMKRHIIIASHRTFSAGLFDALKFFAGNEIDVDVITAYMKNEEVDQDFQRLIKKYKSDDEVIILTDLLAGSVNQQAYLYIKRPHTHVIAGINLPLAMAFVMEPQKSYLTKEKIENLIQDARNQIVYVNAMDLNGKDDEDE